MKIKFSIMVMVLAVAAFGQDDEVIELDEGIDIEVVEDEGAIEKMPEILEFVEVAYPEELIGEGVAGRVLLELIVGETGAVDSVWVVRPLHPALDSLALDAARWFKFSPAEVGGEAVAVMLQYEYEFAPPKTAPPAVAESVGEAAADSTVGTAAHQPAEEDAVDIDHAFEMTVYGREEVKGVARHRLTLAEVKRIPGMGNDAVKVVQAMPGVARPSFGGTEVAVRGAPGWASRYYLDGVAVIGLYHMGGLNSIYPSDALDGLDFYPGGFSARYGGAIAGVIEMRSRRPKADSLRGHVDLSMLNGALFLEGPISERLSFMASARRNFAGDLLALYFKISDPKNTSISMAPFFWDYLFRVDFAVNERHHLFASLLGSRDSLGVFVPSVDVGSSEIGGDLDGMNMMSMFHTLTVGLDSDLGASVKNSLRLAGTYAATRMSMLGMANMNEEPWIWYARNQVSYTHSPSVTVHAGTDIELINENLTIETNTGQNMILRDTTENWFLGTVGGYVNVEWKLLERLLLVPGARVDYYPELAPENSVVPAFRVSGRYELTDDHTVKAAFGMYSQTPEPTGMVIHERFGEPSLPATRAEQYVLGHEWGITDLVSLDAQAYYNHIWNVARQYDPRVDAENLYKRYFGDGRGRMYGLELMLRHARSDKFFGWISYTMSRSETWSKVEDKYILSSRDEPHHLQLLGSWKLRKGWEGGLRLRYVSGKPTSPIIGTQEDENDKRIRAIYGARNSTRHDPFLQLDIRFDKTTEKKGWTLTYYIDLQNVLWPLYKSPELTYYNYNYTEKQNIAMIPMVSLGVRAEF